MSLSLTKSNLSVISTAALTLWAGITIYNWSHMEYLNDLPASHWFEVKNLSVPQHSADEKDIPVIYDRVIHEAFNGHWLAEIHDADTANDVCDGDGRNRYEPGDVLPPHDGKPNLDNIVTLKWFMGKDCILAPGRYVIKVTYKIHTDEGVTKILPVTSNIFTVKQSASAQ